MLLISMVINAHEPSYLVNEAGGVQVTDRIEQHSKTLSKNEKAIWACRSVVQRFHIMYKA